MVEVFQKELVNESLISKELADSSYQGPGQHVDPDAIQQAFERAYKGKEKEFKNALLTARDYLGRLLAKTWGDLSPDFLTYHTILRTLLRADREVSDGQHQDTIRECFAWREISLLPGSILLRPHTIDRCGLKPRHSVIEEILAQLQHADQSTREALRGALDNHSWEETRSDGQHGSHSEESIIGA